MNSLNPKAISNPHALPKRLAKVCAFAAAAIGLLTATSAASAHEYTAQIRAKKYAAVEQLVVARLAAEPTQADALIAKVELITIQGQEERFDEAVKTAEQCIAAHPQKSGCHESLGTALGTKALTSGILSAMGYATKIRDAFKRAVELDTNNLDARFALFQYYQQALGIVGGGKGNAQDLASATGKINPDAGRLMLATLDLADDALDKARIGLLQVNVTGPQAVLDAQRDALVGLGTSYLQAKKYADAFAVFQEVDVRFADSEWGAYGQARTLQDQAKHAEAVPWFEKALGLEPRAHIYYRLAQSLKALNDKARAVAAFEKALAFKPSLGKKQKGDAQDQLKSLKG